MAYGPKLHGLARDKYDLEEIVENSLRKAGLWDEVKDRLNQPGTGLSGVSATTFMYCVPLLLVLK